MEFLPTPGTGAFVLATLAFFAIVWITAGEIAARRRRSFEPPPQEDLDEVRVSGIYTIKSGEVMKEQLGVVRDPRMRATSEFLPPGSFVVVPTETQQEQTPWLEGQTVWELLHRQSISEERDTPHWYLVYEDDLWRVHAGQSYRAVDAALRETLEYLGVEGPALKNAAKKFRAALRAQQLET